MHQGESDVIANYGNVGADGDDGPVMQYDTRIAIQSINTLLAHTW